MRFNIIFQCLSKTPLVITACVLALLVLVWLNHFFYVECTMSNAVSSRVSVAISKDDAWEKLRDLTLAHNYVPSLVKTEITTVQREGVGASRKVYQSETKAIDETVIEWQDGEGFLIRLHRGEKGPPPPFKEAFFRYHIAVGDETGTTILTTTMSYTMGMGYFGALLEKMFLGKIFQSVIKDVALSLKQFYETGERVTPEVLKQIKADYKKANV